MRARGRGESKQSSKPTGLIHIGVHREWGSVHRACTDPSQVEFQP